MPEITYLLGDIASIIERIEEQQEQLETSVTPHLKVIHADMQRWQFDFGVVKSKVGFEIKARVREIWIKSLKGEDNMGSVERHRVRQEWMSELDVLVCLLDRAVSDLSRLNKALRRDVKPHVAIVRSEAQQTDETLQRLSDRLYDHAGRVENFIQQQGDRSSPFGSTLVDIKHRGVAIEGRIKCFWNSLISHLRVVSGSSKDVQLVHLRLSQEIDNLKRLRVVFDSSLDFGMWIKWFIRCVNRIVKFLDEINTDGAGEDAAGKRNKAADADGTTGVLIVSKTGKNAPSPGRFQRVGEPSSLVNKKAPLPNPTRGSSLLEIEQRHHVNRMPERSLGKMESTRVSDNRCHVPEAARTLVRGWNNQERW